MANKITKANGHIVQADWNQTDPLKMDYIHNKPENIATLEDVYNRVEKVTDIANYDRVYAVTKDGINGVTYSIDDGDCKANNISIYQNKTICDDNVPTSINTLIAPDPSNPSNVANKHYVDQMIASTKNLIDYNKVKTVNRDMVRVEKTLEWTDIIDVYGTDTVLGWESKDMDYVTSRFVDNYGYDSFVEDIVYFDKYRQLPIYFSEPVEITFSLGPNTILPSDLWVNTYREKEFPNGSPTDSYGYDITDSYNIYPFQYGPIYGTDEFLSGHELIGITSDYQPEFSWDSYLYDTEAYGGDNLTKSITLIGTRFYIHFFESQFGVLAQDWPEFMDRFSIQLTYSGIIGYPENEDDPQNQGGEATPEHTINLYSNKEVHYSYPVTRLEINDFIASYEEQYAQQWVVSFVAGDQDPIVIIPDNVIWAEQEPTFIKNYKYHLVFKKLGEDYIGFCTEIPMPSQEGEQ